MRKIFILILIALVLLGGTGLWAIKERGVPIAGKVMDKVSRLPGSLPEFRRAFAKIKRAASAYVSSLNITSIFPQQRQTGAAIQKSYSSGEAMAFPAESRLPEDYFPLNLKLSTEITAPYHAAWGVPMPAGLLKDTDHLVLADSKGGEIPSQYKVLSRWPDGSIKSVLVSVLTQVGDKDFSLTYSDRVRQNYDSHLEILETPAAIMLKTGKIHLELSRSKFSLWGGDIVARDFKTKTKYQASFFNKPAYEIVERGPLRSVIRVQGKLTSSQGNSLTDFIIWLTLYADRDYVLMRYTIVDPTPEADVTRVDERALELEEYGLVFPFEGQEYAFGGQGTVHTGTIAPLSEYYLFQDGQMNFVNGSLHPWTLRYTASDERALTNDPLRLAALKPLTRTEDGGVVGNKAPGWGEIKNKEDRLGAAVRHFWQQYPKEFNATDRAFSLWLHPARASAVPSKMNPTTKMYDRPHTFYNDRPGMAKTYELIFTRGGEIEKIAKMFEDEPRLEAPAKWYAQSGVFGETIAAGPESDGYDNYLIDGILTPSITSKLESGSLARPYGWRDYGDRMRGGWESVSPEGIQIPSFYNDTHVGAENFCIQYARTLDQRWFDLCETTTFHWMDIDVSHAPRKGYWKDWTKHGGPKVMMPPGEPHLQHHSIMDHQSRNQHPGHAHVSGLPGYYLFSGNERALEVLKEVGDWHVEFVRMNYIQGGAHYAEAERDFAWPLYVLNKVYRITGDKKYHEAAVREVDYLIDWWKTPRDHTNGFNADGTPKVIGKFDARQGTGYWWMNPKSDNDPEGWNGPSSWFGAALISNILDTLEDDKVYGFLDEMTVKDMLLQTMNNIVKFGYNQTGKFFTYSESGQATGASNIHTLYPLAYLSQIVHSMPHPEWYDTSAQWFSIAQDIYEGWKINSYRGIADQGFYGYEFFFQPQFFKLMSQNTRFFFEHKDSPVGFGVESSAQKVFRDPQKFQGKPGNTLNMTLARNEYESAQLVLYAPKGQETISVEVSDLRTSVNGREVKIDKDNITAFVVGYVKTQKPGYPVSYVGWWPDPLEKRLTFNVNKDSLQPLWIRVYAPEEAPAGEYTGEVTLKLDNGLRQSAILKVKVFDFTLPRETHLKTAFDFYYSRLKQMYLQKSAEDAAEYERRLNSLQNDYFIDMIKHRLMPIFNFRIESDRFAQEIEPYLKAGLNSFSIGSFGGSFDNNWPKETEKLNELLPAYRAYAEILKAENLLGSAYVYTYDEPQYGDPHVAEVAKMIRRAHPDLKNMVCLHDLINPDQFPNWGDDIDIWCVRNVAFDEKTADVYKRNGKELWLYVSGPKPPYPTLVIDYPAMAYRIIPWMCWKYDIKGFLYWTVNFWSDNPWLNPMNTKWEQNGNGLLYYPGESGPVTSIRLEVLRDGIEDYEYLYFLKKKLEEFQSMHPQPSASDISIIKGISKLLSVDRLMVSSMKTYSDNPELLYKKRAQVAQTIEALIGLLKVRALESSDAGESKDGKDENSSNPVLISPKRSSGLR